MAWGCDNSAVQTEKDITSYVLFCLYICAAVAELQLLILFYWQSTVHLYVYRMYFFQMLTVFSDGSTGVQTEKDVTRDTSFSFSTWTAVLITSQPSLKGRYRPTVSSAAEQK